MRLSLSFFILVIFLFIFSTGNVFSKNFIIKDAINPYCNGIAAEEFLEDKKIKNIEIITDKPRKWVKNIFRALLEFNSEESKTENTQWFDFRIREKYKKNFDSNVYVNFEDSNLTCKFRAKVRVTGDLWWHLDWKKGTPLTSVQVRLLDGHINNITRFKLFVPKAREGANNEIFTSSLLSELGFLAPRTFLVSSKINGMTENYIFQEDLRKEFLENVQLVEGPLLEGDERLTIMQKSEKMMPNLSLSRIINKNFLLKGETSQKTALSAVSNLNLIYLQHHQSKKIGKESYLPTDKLHINTEKFFINKINKIKHQTYEALIYALDAYHSLSFDDRRFYFDPINQYFIPIYYDGKSKITEDIQKSKSEFLSTKVSIDAKKGASNAIKLVNSIDHNNFNKKLNFSGVNISSENYNRIIKRIINRLEIISKSKPFSVKFSNMAEYFSKIDKNLIENRKLIFVNLEKKEFYICNFDLNNCETRKNNDIKFNNSLAQILSQRFENLNESDQRNDEYLFVYDDINYEKAKNFSNKKWNIKEINEEFFVKYNDEIKIILEENKKKITIQQTSNSGRAIITGDKIDGWNIIFNGFGNSRDVSVPNNYLNLTGCLTILDIEVTNANFSTKDSLCEDSINFIRVNGDIHTLRTNSSIMDGIDLDFSNLKINLIDIQSAGNDCLDLSYGTYTINYVSVKNCGDKGISIGEKSKTVLKKIIVNKSNIAIAAKDSSLVKVYKSKIYKSPICFSAYRKKQEFSGAKIEIKNTNCDKENFYVQKGSTIVSNL
tara:strand:- start:9224 stop:11551 length:2328 start_codon:yes stop_codon:yes gene_type:complete